jgi:hypothetical protein
MNTLAMINRQLRASGVRIDYAPGVADIYGAFVVYHDDQLVDQYWTINAALEAVRAVIRSHREDADHD